MNNCKSTSVRGLCRGSWNYYSCAKSIGVWLLCKNKISEPLLDQPSGRFPTALNVFLVATIASVDDNNSNGDEAYILTAHISVNLHNNTRKHWTMTKLALWFNRKTRWTVHLYSYAGPGHSSLTFMYIYFRKLQEISTTGVFFNLQYTYKANNVVFFVKLFWNTDV